MNIMNSRKGSAKSYGIGNRKPGPSTTNRLELMLNYAMIPVGLVLTVISLMTTLRRS